MYNTIAATDVNHTARSGSGMIKNYSSESVKVS